MLLGERGKLGGTVDVTGGEKKPPSVYGVCAHLCVFVIVFLFCVLLHLCACICVCVTFVCVMCSFC